MRKYLILLVALAMVLGLSGMAMAAEGSPTGAGISAPATVTATVGQYCSLTVTAPSGLTFEGFANEAEFSTDGDITKDCNTNTTLKAEVTKPLTQGTYTIATLTTLDGGTIWGSPVTITNTYNGSVHTFTDKLGVKGTLGSDISSQPAGDYTGTITVTVYVPAP